MHIVVTFSGKGENHFGRVTVDVRDITNDSAVMDWIVPNDGRVIHSYKVYIEYSFISCTCSILLLCQFPAISRNDDLIPQVSCVEISSTAKENSVITYSAPKSVDHLRIRGLKPESNYSCVLLASHDHSNEEWNRLIQPIEFTTHKTDRARGTVTRNYYCTCSDNYILTTDFMLTFYFLKKYSCVLHITNA